ESTFDASFTEGALGYEVFTALQAGLATGPVEPYIELRGSLSAISTPHLDAHPGGGVFLIGVRGGFQGPVPPGQSCVPGCSSPAMAASSRPRASSPSSPRRGLPRGAGRSPSSSMPCCPRWPTTGPTPRPSTTG